MPIAAYAKSSNNDIEIEGVFASEDGVYFSRKTIKGKVEERRELARILALDLKKEIDLKKKEQISEFSTK